MAGRLFVVSLPIGNLEDITIRALRVLRAVDEIIAEDSRTTTTVLKRFGIRTPFSSSYYEGVEEQRSAPIVRRLQEGADLALVTDAGTPLISDPGYPLVRDAVRAGVPVIPVPGPSAALAALVGSGLPVARFAFDGMLPRTASSRRAYFKSLAAEPRTAILYESPHRLLATLGMIEELLPGRPLVLARELTKLHEEFLRGTATEILEALRRRDRVRGECVLLIGGTEAAVPEVDPERWDELAALLEEANVPRKIASRILAIAFGIAKNDAYRRLSS
jgi:16S rRNA (cytidine1402-2'-O)-methyltransferase